MPPTLIKDFIILTPQQRETHERLLLSSLRQGGLILSELRQIKKDAVAHAKEDAAHQNKQLEINAQVALKQATLEKDMSWIKKTATWVLAVLGVAKILGGK